MFLRDCNIKNIKRSNHHVLSGEALGGAVVGTAIAIDYVASHAVPNSLNERAA